MPEQLLSAAYLGGFVGFNKRQVYNVRIGDTQATVESIAWSQKNAKVLWTMPYDKIKDIRIDTAENITATRLLLTGIFAFALKKRHNYLVIPFEDEHGMMQNPLFEGIHINDIHQAIYQRVGTARARAQPVEQQPQEPQVSAYDELAKLAALRDQGVVTEQEFQEQKAKLLGTQTANQSQKRFDPQTGRPL
jgi:hypothetical protein